MVPPTPTTPSFMKRTRPMRLIVMGMARTGTMSQKTALEMLGYKTHHMIDFAQDADRQGPLWEEAFRSKYQQGKCSLTREDWDELLGDYDSCIDLPSAAFIPELVAAYPEAQVIVSQRPAEKWIVSYENTVLKTRTMATMIPLLLDPRTRAWMKAMWHIDDVFGGSKNVGNREAMMRRYNYLYDEARRVTPKHRLLEWQLVEGWEPLCEFLGQPVPKDTPYPNVNDTAAFIARTTEFRNSAIKRIAGFAVTAIGASVIASTAVYSYLGA